MKRLYLPQEIIYGQDAVGSACDSIAGYGNRYLIITDETMLQLGLVNKLTQTLEGEWTIFSGVTSEPTDEIVNQVLAILQAQEQPIEAIIALGGGSCIDTAKAASVMYRNGYSTISALASAKEFAVSPLPVIAIPTTAGTGSEATDVTVITDTQQQIKYMMKDKSFLPKVAIIDPLMTQSSPPSITAATGLDALCHAIESYISRKAHTLTKELSLSAVKAIMHHIVTAYQDGNHLVAREEMALAALKAGIAFSNASVTLIHGMSRPIGALFHIPHGFSNAILMHEVLDYSKPAIIKPLAELTEYVYPEFSGTDEEKATYFLQQLEDICQTLSIRTYHDFGVNKEQFVASLDKMCDDAFASGSPDNNPVVPTKEEMKQIYLRSWK
ncbi:iron-containing alcohol dehydrogenase [Streptococcus respiraculi]|uniref:iron-containing alcohol dehydrogenase n=1 Tax=Streptococcus respiraculi TaxID=2021971 RepID=UPI000E762B62|nr:iron-containing alcohol dehydrogenase [Streptococcus respiraculi]